MSGDHTIDLKPHRFGFIALNIAGGDELPRQWYEANCGGPVPILPAALRWQLLKLQPIRHCAGAVRDHPTSM